MQQLYFMPYTKIDNLLNILKNNGYTCIAPQLIEGVINYSEITTSQELPWGVIDEQSAGYYKIHKTANQYAFGFTLPAQSVKPLLFKAIDTVFKVVRDESGKLNFEPQVQYQKTAVFGVRACDLRAISVQDKVFIDDTYNDIRYVKRRENQFIIAMNCTNSHANCFCVSLGNGASAKNGFDLAMTEIANGFIVQIGSDIGEEIIMPLLLAKANDSQIEMAQNGIKYAEEKQTKKIPPIEKVQTGLLNNLEHSQYEDVANRCLSCGNCTNSCPTCFCHTKHEEPSISGETSYQVRHWDSCFTLEHSYTHGETYRETPKYRYRQWLTHKFATWQDQFDVVGCVGCGRCITWCPVKIEVVDEINTIVKNN